MLKKDFWYDLPKELIAQEPADPRDSARLMVLDRKNDTIEHRIFHDLPEYLNAGDVLVVNNSKVLPARLMGVKVPTGAVCWHQAELWRRLPDSHSRRDPAGWQQICNLPIRYPDFVRKAG